MIELPKFHGQLAEWLGFRDTFDSLIHKNERITTIQKFHYLRAALEGTAEQIIKSLEFSAENYELAWNALCTRYNNERLLIHNHIKALFKIEPITKEASAQIRRIIDTLNKHLRALKTLKQPTEHWDALLIYLVTTKLDVTTAREWEKERASTQPTLEELKTFLTSRADLLQTLELNNLQGEKGTQPKSKEAAKDFANSKTKAFVTKQSSCILCKENHHIQNCAEFLKISPQERSERIKGAKACINCLRVGHFVKNCKSSSCKRCQAKHNTMLHFDKVETPATQGELSQRESVVLTTRSKNMVEQVILPTASVFVKDRDNKERTARILLDPCSQSSFITQEICDSLRLQKRPISTMIGSLNNTSSVSNHSCQVQVISRDKKFAITPTCLVVPEITSTLPNFSINIRELEIPSHLKLADPLFHEPNKIEILLGADHFWNLLCVGLIKIGKNGTNPVMQKTRLGWIIAGPTLPLKSATSIQCNFSKQVNIEQQLQRFWEIEEFLDEQILSNEEQACEAYFSKTTKRAKDGRFIVKIPFKDSVNRLGNSKSLATRRLLSLERKLEKNVELKRDYVAFLNEYEKLGYMSKVDDNSSETVSYYLPHHGVIREQSASTKLRVVFDASVATTTGISLNDLQMVGPTIQEDLFAILLRFRKHPYIISADIEKMYRQVLVEPEQRSLQKILWRTSVKEPIQTFQLNTVTYGTASAAFLSIRCLVQLAEECEQDLPEIAKIIRKDFYVDDLVTGADTIEDAIIIAEQLSKVLLSGGFNLRKWVSNEPLITERMVASDNPPSTVNFSIDSETKTLGVRWQAQSDSLIYSVGILGDSKVTKRQILSEISQIFDPLGLLGPCIITAKILIKKLWLAKLSWDESLPSELHSQWLNYKSQLQQLNKLKISRQVVCYKSTDVQLHGFSDAAENAYGACVYVRSEDNEGKILVRLLCSKTRVAPVKTIPRLELCGALVLAELIAKTQNDLDTQIHEITYWTDATIVLGWLRSEPHRLPTFVSNRVAKIQGLTNASNWRHVPTKENPADHLSRGIAPNMFSECRLFHDGPPWLALDRSQWPSTPLIDTPSEIKRAFVVKQISFTIDETLFEMFPTLPRLVRLVVSCRRLINHWRNANVPINNPISPAEHGKALMTLAKLSQGISFSGEIDSLRKENKLQVKNLLSPLKPFLDEDEILRVGGRLGNSAFPADKKNPVLLSSRQTFTKLLFQHEHKELLHAGPQMLLATIRDRFWPLGGRNLARKTVRECLTCVKAHPVPMQTEMGNLPSSRVTQVPPFHTTGVDYAGPLIIKDRKGRGAKVSKCWVCLFVCFATKAIHIELVSDLTKDAFIAALRRFASRRGKPALIYSDNGTNFVGANNEFNLLKNFLAKESKDLTAAIDELGIAWHFIPLTLPILEASGRLIEALLNSRPLTPLSSDPNDLTPLTPAHFLIGRTLTSIADPDVTHLPESRTSRWQYIQRLQQHLWKRWSKEYISELQKRTKWKEPYPPLEKNTIVVIKDDNLPPAK